MSADMSQASLDATMVVGGNHHHLMVARHVAIIIYMLVRKKNKKMKENIPDAQDTDTSQASSIILPLLDTMMVAVAAIIILGVAGWMHHGSDGCILTCLDGGGCVLTCHDGGCFWC